MNVLHRANMHFPTLYNMKKSIHSVNIHYSLSYLQVILEFGQD